MQVLNNLNFPYQDDYGRHSNVPSGTEFNLYAMGGLGIQSPAVGDGLRYEGPIY
jgi:hypothetical protein